MQRKIGLAVALILIIGAALVQGKWSERWEDFPELQLFADRVKDVPTTIGQWEGEEVAPTDPKILKMAGAVGSLSRTYKNPAGDVVSIFIVCGRFRDVSYHTPDRCYPAQGFEMVGDVSRESVETGDKNSEFFTTVFQKSDTTGMHAQRIYWTWSPDGLWLAPENQKLTFGNQRALFKLYVVTPINKNAGSSTEHNPAVDFIRVLIPELNKAFFPAQTPQEVTASQDGNPQPAATKQEQS